MGAGLPVVRIPGPGYGQQFPRVAPLRVQRCFQTCAYRDRRDVVERAQHDDIPIGQTHGQHVISIVWEHVSMIIYWTKGGG